jgi:hypothetical protein
MVDPRFGAQMTRLTCESALLFSLVSKSKQSCPCPYHLFDNRRIVLAINELSFQVTSGGFSAASYSI